MEENRELEEANRYFVELEQILRSISMHQLEIILQLLEKAYHHGHRIFIIGNGGSAATASHFALDLAKNTIIPGLPRLKAISLTDHVPLITAWGNDASYDCVFSEQLANMIEAGDIVIGISTSGNSINVLNALHLAKQHNGVAIGLLGAKGGQIKDTADAYILVPGHSIEQEEDVHMILAHIITRHMRTVVQKLAGNG